jgi:hypothetical protein
MPPDLHKLIGIGVTSSFTLACTWLGAVQEHLTLIGVFMGVCGTVAYSISLVIECIRKVRKNRQEKHAEDLALAKEEREEKKRKEDELCELRRKIGHCPLSTFHPNDEHLF